MALALGGGSSLGTGGGSCHRPGIDTPDRGSDEVTTLNHICDWIILLSALGGCVWLIAFVYFALFEKILKVVGVHKEFVLYLWHREKFKKWIDAGRPRK